MPGWRGSCAPVLLLTGGAESALATCTRQPPRPAISSADCCACVTVETALPTNDERCWPFRLMPPHPPPPSQGRPYRAVVSDAEGAHLPARGTLVVDEAEADFVLQQAEELGAAAAGAAAGLASAPSAASIASSASLS